MDLYALLKKNQNNSNREFDLFNAILGTAENHHQLKEAVSALHPLPEQPGGGKYPHTHHHDGIKGIPLHNGPDPHCKDTEISPGIGGWKHVIHASPAKQDKKHNKPATVCLHSSLFPYKHLTLRFRTFLHTDRHKQGVLIPQEYPIPSLKEYPLLTQARPVTNHSPHCEQPVYQNDGL